MFGGVKAGPRESVTPAELQEDIMRFEGRFSSRMVTAFAPLLESDDSSVRRRAQGDQLQLMSAALDIAVGAAPMVDLLDMITLTELGSDAMAARWNVDVYGEKGRGVLDALRASAQDIWGVAHKVVPVQVEADLVRVIRQWQEENPGLQEVASVRLSAYAQYKEEMGSGLSKSASGLFSLLRGAAQTADTAVLLGERALYAAQRLPFLIRMHVRVASDDLFADLERNVRVALARPFDPLNRIGGKVRSAWHKPAMLATTSLSLVRLMRGRSRRPNGPASHEARDEDGHD
jgi:hypothetical protein